MFCSSRVNLYKYSKPIPLVSIKTFIKIIDFYNYQTHQSSFTQVSDINLKWWNSLQNHCEYFWKKERKLFYMASQAKLNASKNIKNVWSLTVIRYQDVWKTAKLKNCSILNVVKYICMKLSNISFEKTSKINNILLQLWRNVDSTINMLTVVKYTPWLKEVILKYYWYI